MRARTARGGFTLFEVLLALAILGAALAVISQIVWSGMGNARLTEDTVQAELLAETVMAEILAGIRPLESAADSSFEEEDGLEDPDDWVYSVEVASLDSEALAAVTVTVRATTDELHPAEFKLHRWVLLPVEEEEDEDTEAQDSL